MIRWTDLSFDLMPDGSHQGKVRVELIAYDRDGKALNWVGGVTNMNLKAEIFESIQKSGVPAHVEIDVPKRRRLSGDWRLRSEVQQSGDTRNSAKQNHSDHRHQQMMGTLCMVLQPIESVRVRLNWPHSL